MPRYLVSGAIVRSAVAMPELPHAGSAAPPDLTYTLHHSIDAAAVDWYHAWTDADGSVSARFGRWGTLRHLVRFPELADFVIETRTPCPAVTCVPADSVSNDVARLLFLEQVLPLVLNRGRRVAFHAAAVSTADVAVVFVGGSGSGKSTLCAACCAAGDELLADDAAVVSVDARAIHDEGTARATRAPVRVGAVVHPSYPTIRLRRDSLEAVTSGAPGMPGDAGSPKVRLAPAEARWRMASEAVDAAAFFVLAPPFDGIGPVVTPLSRRDGLAALLPHVYRLDPHSRDDMRRELHLLTALAASTPVFVLSVPRAYDALPAARRAVLAAVRRPVRA